MMLSTQIRRQFIEYFVKQRHKHVPSSPVVPHKDPTLLFTNAGMNQFKSFFLGDEEPSFLRAVTSQKCIRVGGKHNDLENVGHTTRHLTFFEMLGNFSFGDYFKKEAIDFAWQVTTEVFQFDLDKLWVSVYYDDDEAYEYWKKHLPHTRIVRIETDDNFWSMGEVGLCGPCTELFYDKGEKFGKATSPDVDQKGERFFEFWNLVFMQFDRDASGKLHLLPKPCVDTGAGLERIISLKMGVDNIFETDLLQGLIEEGERVFDLKYKDQNKERKAAFHVIVDHLRTLCFAIADGVQPSNVDRGYVLRKVLRRAVRYGRSLNAHEPFLNRLVPKLLEYMGADYPELITSKHRIEEILQTEEEAFLRTLKRGGNLLSHVIKEAKGSKNQMISGEDAFKLKDTYGLPLEEIELMAKDSDLHVDLKRFEELSIEAKELSKKSKTTHVQSVSKGLYQEFLKTHSKTEFVGYEHSFCRAKILGILKDGQWVQELKAKEKGDLFLDKTPFYAEMGGQVGDQGTLFSEQTLFQVQDTQSPYTNLVAHHGFVKEGTLKVHDIIEAKINQDRRKEIAKNHTATHLLHWALIEVLGEHVKQAGSLVEENRLRFDFSHHKALTEEELHKIEDLVNLEIRRNHPVHKEEKPFSEIKERADIKQFFGDKYGEFVRVVDMGCSKELCGGTHTSRTGDIGFFKLLKEQSVAAGIRRLEALTGSYAEKKVRADEELMQELSHQLKTTPQKFSEKLSQLLDDHKNLLENNKQLIAQKNQQLIKEILRKKEVIKGYTLVCSQVQIPSKELREFTLQMIHPLEKTFAVLCTIEDQKVSLMVAFSEDLKALKKSAKDFMQPLLGPIEGKGGGKDLLAQAGGTHPERLHEVFEKAKTQLQQWC